MRKKGKREREKKRLKHSEKIWIVKEIKQINNR